MKNIIGIDPVESLLREKVKIFANAFSCLDLDTQTELISSAELETQSVALTAIGIKPCTTVSDKVSELARLIASSNPDIFLTGNLICSRFAIQRLVENDILSGEFDPQNPEAFLNSKLSLEDKKEQEKNLGILLGYGCENAVNYSQFSEAMTKLLDYAGPNMILLLSKYTLDPDQTAQVDAFKEENRAQLIEALKNDLGLTEDEATFVASARQITAPGFSFVGNRENKQQFEEKAKNIWNISGLEEFFTRRAYELLALKLDDDTQVNEFKKAAEDAFFSALNDTLYHGMDLTEVMTGRPRNKLTFGELKNSFIKFKQFNINANPQKAPEYDLLFDRYIAATELFEICISQYHPEDAWPQDVIYGMTNIHRARLIRYMTNAFHLVLALQHSPYFEDAMGELARILSEDEAKSFSVSNLEAVQRIFRKIVENIA